MAKSDSSFISLLAHPDTLHAAVRRVAVSVEWVSPDSLRFQYVLEADLRRLCIPPPVADAGRTDELWAHTCFEVFVGFARSPRYLELNFSPSGQWAAYRFESYRQGRVAAALDALPRLALSRSEGRLELQAEVSLGGLLRLRGPFAEASADRRLRIGLSAVVEDQEGRLSYWALRHPPGRPDFHHPHGFSLALEFPGNHP